MRKIIILLLCCFISISCRTMPKFEESELSEYFDLCMALDKVDLLMERSTVKIPWL